jgi:hypothetical protein
MTSTTGIRGRTRQLFGRNPLGAEIRTLHRRIDQLEEDVQDARRLHLRVAELLDVVQELLLPASSRDEGKLREAIDKFSGSL